MHDFFKNNADLDHLKKKSHHYDTLHFTYMVTFY